MAAEDATDLFAELDADQSGRGAHCTVGQLLADLPDTERGQWEAAFVDRKYSAASLFRAMRRRNYIITEQPVVRHARRVRSGTGGCQCPI